MERIFPGTLRSRIVLVATGVSATVLVLVLVVLYLVLAAELRAGVNDTIGARLDDLASAVAAGDDSVLAADPYAQLVAPDGRVLARSGAAPEVPVVPVGQARAAATTDRVLERHGVPGLPGASLFRARLIPRSGDVLVAGGSLDAAEAARERTLVLLLVSLPVLALALLVGVRRVVAAAMRPVRRLTREAEEISTTDLNQRLPLVPGNDELAELSRTLNAMLDRLARSVRREREFLDDASHELRTPLAVLLGELELALTVDDPGEVRHGLHLAHEEARRLAGLAQDLLVLARQRADARSGGDAGRPVDLAEVAASAAERIRPALACRVDVTGDPAVVRADPDRLERLVTNLVQNAASAGSGRALCRTGRDGPDAVLEVCDDGPGFPPALLPHAFERFRHADPARTRRTGTGTGLGLAIVAAIAESLGGSATAANDSPLGGARVVVRLPSAGPGTRPHPRLTQPGPP